MGHNIRVRIGPDGQIEVSVDGLKGASCKDVTKAVEKALGATTSDANTPEFNQIGSTVQIKQGGK